MSAPFQLAPLSCQSHAAIAAQIMPSLVPHAGHTTPVSLVSAVAAIADGSEPQPTNSYPTRLRTSADQLSRFYSVKTNPRLLARTTSSRLGHKEGQPNAKTEFNREPHRETGG
jgi:hypothetical protein